MDIEYVRKSYCYILLTQSLLEVNYVIIALMHVYTWIVAWHFRTQKRFIGILIIMFLIYELKYNYE